MIFAQKVRENNTVREMGLEPTRQRHRNLNPARLPIPPLAQHPKTVETLRI